jgi:undecaprenyl-diphosphatase|tara:strand:- start:3598 stop:4416 length:819 start_codon:yes stop_codon:yes gene_type:complete
MHQSARKVTSLPEIANIVLLGIIEGITEFLPISSTGHLLIAEQWLGQRSDLFNIVIQAGAMLAVTLVYRKRLLDLAIGLRRPENLAYAVKLIAAFLITAVLGLVAKNAGFSLPTSLGPVAWALIVGGVWILASERWLRRQQPRSTVTWATVIAVGVAQVVAGIFPGTSRSAACIFAAIFAGTTDRAAATEFTFLVGIPTMYAASAYELYDQSKVGFTGEDFGMLALAFIVSTGVAFVAVKWLLGFIRNHSFCVFAYYRIIFGTLLLTLAAAT